jgi:hypothetical protein
MNRSVKIVVITAALLAVGIQLYPVDRSNPPVLADVNAPAAVDSILRTACYACHSNETNWPWYSYVAPASWMVVDHVHEGRDELNFSEWGAVTAEELSELLEEISEEVEEGKMPLRSYRALHPAARLSQEQRAALSLWADQSASGPLTPDSERNHPPNTH